MPGEQILVVDDDPGITELVVRSLRTEGYTVTAAPDGVSGSRQALTLPVDLVLLDLVLPGRSGYEVLADLHASKPGVPVMVLTARGDVDDRVAALDSGAVDYMVKPFSLAEMKARVRAHLRFAAEAVPGRLRGAGIEADLLTREVLVGGEPIRLSVREFELLCHMLRNPGRVLSREEILRAVWGYEHDPATNVVDVYVGYLRRKLGRSGAEIPIVTIRSVGYRFDGRMP